MTSIVEKERVAVPLGAAERFIAVYLAEHRAPSGEGARVTLRAGELERPAIISIDPLQRPGDMAPRFNVHWESEAAGPYPVFDGILTVDAGDDYNTFWLALDGGYEPPGGVLGKAFDAVVGKRVSEETTRGLLRNMRDEIEAKFAGEERGKQQ